MGGKPGVAGRPAEGMVLPIRWPLPCVCRGSAGCLGASPVDSLAVGSLIRVGHRRDLREARGPPPCKDLGLRDNWGRGDAGDEGAIVCRMMPTHCFCTPCEGSLSWDRAGSFQDRATYPVSLLDCVCLCVFRIMQLPPVSIWTCHMPTWYANHNIASRIMS